MATSRSAAQTRRGKSRRPGRRIGIALAGGGFLGAAYELGVLAALAEAVDGLDLNALDAYVGVSAGSFIAAGLASGRTPHQMVRMFVEDAEMSLDPATMLRPSARPWLRGARAIPRALGHALAAVVRGEMRTPSTVAWQLAERLGTLLPPGVLDTSHAERTLDALFAEAGRDIDFRSLEAPLRIVATDIDNGQAVEFGAPGFDTVPIARALLASSAVPGLFPPVEIGGRYYVDGALNKTLHASVALDEGADLVLCINPLVPFTPPATARPGTIAGGGLAVILSQSIRTAIRSRMSVGLQKYSITHPDARVLLFEPRGDDAGIFFTNMFTLASRRSICEQAYQQTRADLLARFDAFSGAFGDCGLTLNRGVLSDRGLTLVRTTPSRGPGRSGRLADGVLRLRHALDDLDRALRVSGARRATATSHAARGA